MPKQNERRGTYDSKQTALSWLELGIQPVPLKAKSKAPKGLKGWNALRVTKETVPKFFGNGDNVGGLWGEPSGWIVDVDLDWDEACDVAEKLLPSTFVYGRRSRPASHYLFRCKGISGSKRTLRSGEVVAEIRSTGSQSVLPPSIHPDNERYHIDHEAAFKTIARLDLEKAVSEVAAAAVFVRYYPAEGSRHDYIHAITGAVMHSGWNETRTRRFLTAILSAVDDDDVKQRGRTVQNTIEHFKSGDRIMGWRTLAQWLKGEIVQALRQWLVPKRKYELPPEHIEDGSTIGTIPKFDEALLEVDGIVGRLAVWSKAQSFLYQPAFDLAVGLMCTSLASCNRYVVQGWNTPLQPYFMLLAPTAAGKGAAISTVYKFAKKIGLQDYVYQGFQSYYVMLDRLAEPPNMACWLWDEAARHLASARAPGSPDFATVSHLISLYGRADDDVPGSPGRRNSIPPLTRPFLTLLATAQPAQLIDAISVADLATGFVNRLVLFDSGDGAPEANLEREDVFPSVMQRAALELKRHEPRGNTTIIKFEAPVYAHFRDFDSHSREIAARGEEHEIWGRANQNALILAGIVAVGINPKRPTISLGVAEWATRLVRWSIGCWMTRIGETASRSRRESQSKKVEALIRRSKALAHRAGKKGKYQEMMKQGRMPRAVLLRLCRDLNSRDLEDIVNQLIESDLIGTTQDDTGSEWYWPKV